jgi:hypothetical protein
MFVAHRAFKKIGPALTIQINLLAYGWGNWPKSREVGTDLSQRCSRIDQCMWSYHWLSG